MLNYQNPKTSTGTSIRSPILHSLPPPLRQEHIELWYTDICIPRYLFYCNGNIAIFLAQIAILKIFFEKFPPHQFLYSKLGVTDRSQIIECNGYCCKDKADQKAAEDIRIICETSRLLNRSCMSYPGK